MRYRRYADGDQEVVWWLHEESLKAIGMEPLDRSANADLNRIAETYIDAGGDFIIMEDDVEVVGMAALKKRTEGVVELKRMRIHPRMLRRGLGMRLLRHMMDLAEHMGFREVVLDTTVQQIGARKLYERFGFQKTGDGEFMGHAILYYKYRLQA